jgi:class 3 adenylate cyclase
MLDAAVLGGHWCFLGLFFRIKTNLKWLPVGVYTAMIPVFLLCGRLGFGLDAIIWIHQTYEWHSSLSYLAGGFIGLHAWWVTRSLSWARFRTVVSLAVAFTSLAVAAAYVLMGLTLPGIISRENMVSLDFVFQFVKYGPRGFVLLVGFVIALEWSIIVRDRQMVLQRFGRVVDPRLVNDIIRGPEKESKVIDHAIIFFIDIRSFTTICEVYNPDRVIRALNEYLDVVTTAVQAQGGIVDKFVGDAVMAIWGVPESGDDDSLAAVKAAIEIRKGMAALNARREASGEFGIDIGIGIHAGPAIFGAMGNGVRVDHTVIGPTINIASRLESMTKELECDIVISNSVLEKIERLVLVDDLGLVNIRGMTGQVGVAKLIGVQVSDSEFIIGHKTLEQEISLRRPGKITGSPRIVSSRTYSNEGENPRFDDSAA